MSFSPCDCSFFRLVFLLPSFFLFFLFLFTVLDVANIFHCMIHVTCGYNGRGGQMGPSLRVLLIVFVARVLAREARQGATRCQGDSLDLRNVRPTLCTRVQHLDFLQCHFEPNCWKYLFNLGTDHKLKQQVVAILCDCGPKISLGC